jgi:hypothetical protein
MKTHIMKKRIAVLAWGSLTWDQGELKTRSEWYEDGPLMPIEFARISLDGRLTLVIKPGYRKVRVFHAESEFSSLQEARENLCCRERTDMSCIGYYDFLTGDNSILRAKQTIELSLMDWARNRGYHAVIWTDLGAKFSDVLNKKYSFNKITEYLNSLSGDSWVRAAEYIIRTPKQIDTSYSSALTEYVIDRGGYNIQQLDLKQLYNQKIENGISEKDIPVISEYNDPARDFFKTGLHVKVDDCKAIAVIRSLSHSSQKIVIKLLEQHPVLSNRCQDGVFMTKYYKIEHPGILEWGGSDIPVIIQKY